MAEDTRKSVFVSIFVPFIPIVSAYSYRFTLIDVSTTILVVLLIIEILLFGNIEINGLLNILIIYCSILSCYLVVTGRLGMNTALGQIIRYIVVGFSIGTFGRRIDVELLYKTMKIVGIVVILGMFYHSFRVYIQHQPVSPIEILPVNNYDNWSLNAMRPMSFFTEPQAFATYCIPLLIFSLDRKEYFISGLVIVSTLLSSSTLGVAATGVVFIMYIIAHDGISSIRKVFFCLLLVLFIAGYSSLSIFETSLGKLSSIGSSYSDYQRLYKAYDTFWELPPINKVFGVGHGTIANFAVSQRLSLWWLTRLANDYLTTGFGVFVEYGIIGGILLYLHYGRSYKRSRGVWTARILLISILVQIFTTTFFFNSGFLYYFLLFEVLLLNSGIPTIKDRLRVFI